LSLVQRFKAAAAWGGLSCLAIGVGSLLLLAFDSADILHTPWLVAMKANTAVGFVLVGLALGLRLDALHGRWARLAAAALVLLGASTLFEYGVVSLGIDELVIRDTIGESLHVQPPGRMSPATASSFVLLGVALWLVRRGSVRQAIVAQGLAIATGLSALLALLGYLYGVRTLYTIGPYASVSLPSALGFAIGSASVLLLDAERGPMALVISDSAAGHIVRRLLPAALLTPILLGWLRWQGQQAGFYDTQFGVALFAALSIVCFVALVWWTATSLSRSDRAMNEAAARLQVLAKVSQAFSVVVTDYPSLLESVVRTASDLVGDGCMVTLLEPDGKTLINAANAHRDPGIELDYKAYFAALGQSTIDDGAVAANVARTGQPRLVPEISPAQVVEMAEPKLKTLVARLNVHSFAVVPIHAHGAVIGTMSLLRSGPGRPYTTEDLKLLEDVADRAGLAIENARLYADLERRVRARTSELEEANQELEAFSYSVAHDLRAPLRAINGFSSAVLEDASPLLDAESIRHLQLVAGSAEHMALLIDALLNLARVSRAEVRRTDVDLAGLARSVIAQLRDREPERAVEVTIAEPLHARGDERLLNALLENLLGNAWKFTKGREPARIELGRRDIDGAPAFFVRDDGAGFNMAYAQKLFIPFQRLHTREEFEGTGIGLATVQRIVRRHGGRIWAESSEQQGATFYFTLSA